MKKNITYIIIIILVVIIQIDILNNWGIFFQYINPILIALILILLLRHFDKALLCALVAGLLLDLYSVLNFGIYTFVFVCMITFIYYFFQKFITNRSLYTFILLTSVGTLFYYLMIGLISYMILLMNLGSYSVIIDLHYLWLIFVQMVLNSIIIAIIYFLIHYVSDKLKSNFILKEKI